MIPEFISNNLSFIVFILILSLFLYVKRKNLDMQGSFPFLYMMMYKTSLGLDKMDKWSKKHPNIFLYLSYLSVFIGIVGMVLITVFMIWQLYFIVDNEITAGGGLVLPIKTESGLDSPVPVFYVPFWYWIVALFILAIVHEFAHGVIAERFNIRIKSSGFAFLGIIAPIVPAAFVEPDEKIIKKKPLWQQIAVYGAGSTSNFLFGILFFLIWIFAAGPLIDNTMTFGEISFSEVMNESSLKEHNINSGQILAVNDEYNTEKIVDKILNLTPNESLSLTINESGILNTYDVTTFENENSGRGMIGISGLQFDYVNKEGYDFLGDLPLHFERMLFYIWFLNIAIGMMNLLPLWITDGGQIAREVLRKYIKKEERAMKYFNYISLFCLILIILTVWPEIMFSFLKILNFF